MLTIVFTVSVCSKVSSWFGGFFDIMDAPYRLTNYVNLFALIICIMLAGWIGRAYVNHKQMVYICLAFCIGISFTALTEKLVHIRATSQKLKGENAPGTSPYLTNYYLSPPEGEPWVPLPFGTKSHLNELPPGFYWYGSFSVKDGFAKDTVSGTFPVIYQNFNVLDGAGLGKVEGLNINLMETSLVVTNVQPFPWNQIVVDDQLQSQAGIIVAEGPKVVSPYIEEPSAGRGAVLLFPGRHHLECVTRVDGIWKILNVLSWMILFGWMTAYAVVALGSIFSKEEHS